MRQKLSLLRKIRFSIGFPVAVCTIVACISLGIFGDRMLRDDASLSLEIPVLAQATSYGEDGYVVGTARLEEDLDAFYFLDGLTGELKVLAINPRTGKFMAEFSHNIVKDFNLERDVKNPRFMVVTGIAALVGKAEMRWGLSVFYILERTSGKALCYGIKFPTGLRSHDGVYRGTLTGLDAAKLRETKVRD